LRHLVPFADPAVLVDASTGDDAAVYRLDAERALAVTADFFTAVVDDPYDFGRIAAANALSDIYAMGARPLFALNLIAFPRALLGSGALEEIVRGGGEVAAEAGIAVVGGHSVDDPEPKYGMCVVGELHPDAVVRNSGARAGDLLVLTKPLGTGVIATALKAGSAPEASVAAAVTAMTTLNRSAAEAMTRIGVHAATDVSGFGLLGHLGSLLRASGAAARIHASAIPLLPGARELADQGHLPGGTTRNREDVALFVDWEASVPMVLRLLLCDAQTSGGLLIAVPGDRALPLLEALRESRTPTATIIGEVVAGETGRIQVVV
jgi:selenide,water dikinase